MTSIKEVSKNAKLLVDFANYCFKHPDERFWQALRNWSCVNKIYIEMYDKGVDDQVVEDTFYFDKKNK